MDCQSFSEMVSDLTKDREDPGKREALEHASSCEACSVMLQQHLYLTSLLSEYKQADSQRPSEETEKAVLLRFRKRNRRWIPYREMAAVLALALLSSALYYFYAAPVTLRSKAHPDTTKPSAALAWRIAESEPLRFAQKTEPVEIASDFIPLYDHVALKPAQIVRVQLSQGALWQLGLSISDASVSGPIIADIVLSEEGTPQAIRLIRKTSF